MLVLEKLQKRIAGSQDRTQDLLDKPSNALPSEPRVLGVINLQTMGYKQSNVSYFEIQSTVKTWGPGYNVWTNQKPPLRHARSQPVLAWVSAGNLAPVTFSGDDFSGTCKKLKIKVRG